MYVCMLMCVCWYVCRFVGGLLVDMDVQVCNCSGYIPLAVVTLRPNPTGCYSNPLGLEALALRGAITTTTTTNGKVSQQVKQFK